MNFRLSNIPPTRRLFLGAVVVIGIVLGWVFTEEMRTDVRNFYLGPQTLLNRITGYRENVSFGGEPFSWSYSAEGYGQLYCTSIRGEWEHASISKVELADVTVEDVDYPNYIRTPRVGISPQPSPSMHIVLIPDDHIVLLRRASEPATVVYAIQAVKQTRGRGHFRSRRILPAAGEGGPASNAFPVAPTNR